MITTVADLLEKIKGEEERLLEKYSIVKNPLMIGNMYEGLTKSLMSKTIFEDMDISVVSGKIRNSQGEFSKQIDCMIVEGRGERLPYSDDHIYDLNQVIAVIEVKKNLFGRDVDSAYQNLKSVADLKDGSLEVTLNLFRDAFESIAKTSLPYVADVKGLPIGKRMLYDYLLIDTALPVRIVFGYDGFKSEFSLRESFASYLERHVLDCKTKQGNGPWRMPNLIICGSFSIVKANGMPYNLKYRLPKGYCPLFASYAKTPFLLALELIWTRLAYKYRIQSDIFGEDLEMELLHPLISCKPTPRGWILRYEEYGPESLGRVPEKMKWKPVVLNHVQFGIISQLCEETAMNINDEDFVKYINGQGWTIEEFTDGVVATGLVVVDTHGNLKLRTNVGLAIAPDLSFVAGDDTTGRFSRWLRRAMKRG